MLRRDLPPPVFLMADIAACGTNPRPIVMVRDEPDLCRVIRERCAELQITYETLEAVTLMPSGYASKLLCEHPVKHMGAAMLWTVLGTLGFEIGLVTTDVPAHLRARMPVREHAPQTQGKRRLSVSLTLAFMSKIGRKGGKARAAAARKRKCLSDLNRRKALTRWHKPEISE
jgi:hypothetical protein